MAQRKSSASTDFEFYSSIAAKQFLTASIVHFSATKRAISAKSSPMLNFCNSSIGAMQPAFGAVSKNQTFWSCWNRVETSVVILPFLSRAKFWVLLRQANECAETSYSVPKSFFSTTRSLAKYCYVWQCRRRIGSPAFTGSPCRSKRSLGSKLSITQTVLNESNAWSDASCCLLTDDSTLMLFGVDPTMRFFLYK